MTYKEKRMIDDLQARLHEALQQIKDQQATVTKRDGEIAALMKEMAVWKTKVAQMNVFSARIMGR
jgi:peptidoglycan hydrolase CwlO-like protein